MRRYRREGLALFRRRAAVGEGGVAASQSGTIDLDVASGCRLRASTVVVARRRSVLPWHRKKALFVPLGMK
jgi:hypothetical protein